MDGWMDIDPEKYKRQWMDRPEWGVQLLKLSTRWSHLTVCDLGYGYISRFMFFSLK